MSDDPRRPTPRQHQLLQLLAQGHTVVTAAQELGIGYDSAKTHLKHAFKRVGAPAQAPAVVRTYLWWPELYEDVPRVAPRHEPRLLQLKILARVSTGATQGAAGAELYLTESETKNEVRKLRYALNSYTTTQAAFVAHREGLIRPRSVIR